MDLTFSTALLATTVYVTEHRAGVLALLDPPRWVRLVAVVTFMDFMLYVWHLLNHEMPLLWRFHRVHHSDLNMDVSTATRFHIGELAIAALIKLARVFFLGVTLAELLIFKILLVASAQFQHSVVRVPAWFERVYWAPLLPPSMRRIHHSVVIRKRADTNYGTIFSVWDRVLNMRLTEWTRAGSAWAPVRTRRSSVSGGTWRCRSPDPSHKRQGVFKTTLSLANGVGLGNGTSAVPEYLRIPSGPRNPPLPRRPIRQIVPSGERRTP